MLLCLLVSIGSLTYFIIPWCASSISFALGRLTFIHSWLCTFSWDDFVWFGGKSGIDEHDCQAHRISAFSRGPIYHKSNVCNIFAEQGLFFVLFSSFWISVESVTNALHLTKSHLFSNVHDYDDIIWWE